jgi:hypothetical protein
MGLWFLLSVAMVLASGFWLIYSQLRSGFPARPEDFQNPLLFLGLFLVIVAIGLLARQRWARAAALGIWIVAVPGTVLFLYGQWPIEKLALAVVVALVLATKFFKVMVSSAMDDLFGPRPAVWLIALMILPLASTLYLKRSGESPLIFKAVNWIKSGAPPVQLAPVVARDEAPAAMNSSSTPGAPGVWVRACKISLDETRLLLVTSDGYGHIVDLRSGRFDSYASRIQTRHWPDLQIGPDADMYFDPDRNVILRFSDSSYRFGAGGGSNQFASFTSTPNQIVVYNRDTRLLRRIEIPIGTVIWSLKISEDAKNIHFPSFTSPDYTWMSVSFGKNRLMLISMREGRQVEITPDYDEVLGVQFGAKWALAQGMYKGAVMNYAFDLPNVNARPEPKLPDEAISTYDVDRQVYVTEGGPGRVISVRSGEFNLSGAVLGSAVLNPNRFVATMEHGQNQITLVDLDTKSVTKSGRVHEQSFSQESSCFTASSTRRLFAATVGSKVEVFWSDFLAADKFRSVLLTLTSK